MIDAALVGPYNHPLWTLHIGVPTWGFVIVWQHEDVGHQVVRIEASDQEGPAVRLELRRIELASVLRVYGR